MILTGARYTAGVVRIRVMTQTASAETVFAKGILDVAIAIRTTTFAQIYNRAQR